MTLARRFIIGFCLVLIPQVYPGVPNQVAMSASLVHSSHGRGVVNLMLGEQVRHILGSGHANAMVTVEVTSSRDVSSAVRALGGAVLADIGGRVTVLRIPPQALAALARTVGVMAIFPSQQVSATLDRSVPETRADAAWKLSDRAGLPLKGSHVLVGIVDSGIDYRNPDFQNADGSTRIKYIWDQTQEGKPPSGYTFGYECNAVSIDAGSCPEKDADGHGTFVAGVAAGNGTSSIPAREIGVAPRADIIVVKRHSGVESEADIIAGWKYLVDKANQLGEPIVINNSFGMGIGPHDGTSPEAQAIDLLSGPGRVFVVAAGNDGNVGAHTSGSLTVGSQVPVQFTVDAQDGKFGMGLFYPPASEASITLTNVDSGETFGPLNLKASIDSQLSRDNDTQVSLWTGDWDGSHRGAFIKLVSKSKERIQGKYRLDIHATHVSGNAHYDAWMNTSSDGTFSVPDETDTVTDPADARSAIAVGSYITRTTWVGGDNRTYPCSLHVCSDGPASGGEVARYSSSGPTLDGRQKPDISAPGTMIVSSRSRDVKACSQSNEQECFQTWELTPDGKNAVEQGTSAAAPHVAGAVALMLQDNPRLDPFSVISILRSTARHDSLTGSDSWTRTFGAGKLDALAALQAVPDTFEYGAGWQQVAAFPAGSVASVERMFRYNSDDGTYVVVATTGGAGATSCSGYWAFFAGPVAVNIPHTVAGASVTCQLASGWNMIANPFSRPVSLPVGSTTYHWNGTSYDRVSVIAPGSAVWIYNYYGPLPLGLTAR